MNEKTTMGGMVGSGLAGRHIIIKGALSGGNDSKKDRKKEVKSSTDNNRAMDEDEQRRTANSAKGSWTFNWQPNNSRLEPVTESDSAH